VGAAVERPSEGDALGAGAHERRHRAHEHLSVADRPDLDLLDLHLAGRREDEADNGSLGGHSSVYGAERAGYRSRVTISSVYSGKNREIWSSENSDMIEVAGSRSRRNSKLSRTIRSSSTSPMCRSSRRPRWTTTTWLVVPLPCSTWTPKVPGLIG